MSKTNILLVEDHVLIRDGIKNNLSDYKEYHIVGETDSAEETLTIIKTQDVDVVFLDISLTDTTGIDLIQPIREIKPELKIIMLTMHDKKEYIQKSFDQGANGYLLKSGDGSELHEAIQAVMAGKHYFTSDIYKQLLQINEDAKLLQRKTEQKNSITKRERQILHHVVKGLSSTKISAELGISPRTVEAHRANAMKKLDAKNVAELVLKCQEILD